MPETNEDRNVEDVLSSVRRLVSGEISGRVRHTRPPQALVLTPTQRVSQARDVAGAKSLEDRIAELEAQLAGRQDEWEPDGSEDQSEHRPTEAIVLPPSDAEEDEAEAEETQPAGSEDEFVYVPEDALPTDETKSEDAVTSERQASEYEPSDPPQQVRRLSRIELIETTPADEDNDSDEAAEAEPEAAEPGSDPEAEDPPAEARMAETAPEQLAEEVAPEPDFDKDLARAVAESVNAVISDITGDDADDFEDAPEPAELGPDDTAAAAADADRHDRPDAETEAVRDSLESAAGLHAGIEEIADEAAAGEAALTDAPAGPDHPDDVPASTYSPVHHAAAPAERLTDDLRDIVAQLIREELQGELGARITRNVRKLVRREIQRALAARDLS